MKDLIIIGAGGLGKEVAGLIRFINNETPTWNFLGFATHREEDVGTENSQGKIITTQQCLAQWKTPIDIVIAIGTSAYVKAIYESLREANNPNLNFPNIVVPNVFFLDEKTVKLGVGNIISLNCSISCDSEIGDFNLFNGSNVLGHDVTIGSYNSFMPASRLSGHVKVGDGNFFGLSAIVLDRVKIGNNTRIGAGSVIMRKTKDGALYLGNPAKRIDLGDGNKAKTFSSK